MKGWICSASMALAGATAAAQVEPLQARLDARHTVTVTADNVQSAGICCVTQFRVVLRDDSGATPPWEVASLRYQFLALPVLDRMDASSIVLCRTESLRKAEVHPVGGVIFRIARAGDAILAGTNHGTYVLRGGALTRIHMEPDINGISRVVVHSISR